MSNINLILLNKKKRNSHIALVIFFIFLFPTLGFLFEFDFWPLTIFGFISLVTLAMWKIFIDEYKHAIRYLDLIRKGHRTIDEIAKITMIPKEDIIKEITSFIVDEIFVNIILIENTGMLELIENTSQPYSTNSIKSSTDKNELHTCPGCGYKIKKTSSVQICQFCGNQF